MKHSKAAVKMLSMVFSMHMFNVNVFASDGNLSMKRDFVLVAVFVATFVIALLMLISVIYFRPKE